MLPLRIKRRRNLHVNAKQALRRYVDQLPIEQQREFVSVALQLINAQPDSRQAASSTNQLYRQQKSQW